MVCRAKHRLNPQRCMPVACKGSKILLSFQCTYFEVSTFSDPPLFYKVVILDYESSCQVVLPNVQQFSSMGDAVRLSTNFDDWVSKDTIASLRQHSNSAATTIASTNNASLEFMNIQQLHFEPDQVKIEADAARAMAKFFPHLTPTRDSIVLCGRMTLSCSGEEDASTTAGFLR